MADRLTYNEHTHPPEWWREQKRVAGVTMEPITVNVTEQDIAEWTAQVQSTAYPCDVCAVAKAIQKTLHDPSIAIGYRNVFFGKDKKPSYTIQEYNIQEKIQAMDRGITVPPFSITLAPVNE